MNTPYSHDHSWMFCVILMVMREKKEGTRFLKYKKKSVIGGVKAI